MSHLMNSLLAGTGRAERDSNRTDFAFSSRSSIKLTDLEDMRCPDVDEVDDDVSPVSEMPPDSAPTRVSWRAALLARTPTLTCAAPTPQGTARANARLDLDWRISHVTRAKDAEPTRVLGPEDLVRRAAFRSRGYK